MIVAKPSNDIRNPFNGISMVKDEEYMMSGHDFKTINRSPGDVKLIYCGELKEKASLKEYSGEDLNNKTLFIHRTGGAGDVLFVTSIAKTIKDKYPSSTIIFATSPRFSQLAEMCDYFDVIHKMPVKMSAVNACDYYISYEGVIEGGIVPEKRNCYDVFASKSFVDKFIKDEDKHPFINVPDLFIEEARNFLKKNGFLDKKFVTIQAAASAALRTYPPEKTSQLIEKISRRSPVVMVGPGNMAPFIDVLIDEADVRNSAHKKVVSLADLNPSWKETSAIVSLSSCSVGPDSSLIHLAAGLGVPVVGIYGPFTSESRIKYYKNAIGVEFESECKPCFKHGHRICCLAMAAGKITSRCLDAIPPHTIFECVSLLMSSDNKVP